MGRKSGRRSGLNRQDRNDDALGHIACLDFIALGHPSSAETLRVQVGDREVECPQAILDRVHERPRTAHEDVPLEQVRREQLQHARVAATRQPGPRVRAGDAAGACHADADSAVARRHPVELVAEDDVARRLGRNKQVRVDVRGRVDDPAQHGHHRRDAALHELPRQGAVEVPRGSGSGGLEAAARAVRYAALETFRDRLSDLLSRHGSVPLGLPSCPPDRRIQR